MRNLKFTLKVWPVVTLVTIGLSFLTETAAGWCGIDLPEQANVALVRKSIGWNRTFVFLVAQVILLLPALEEFLFRYLLAALPVRIARKRFGASSRPAFFIFHFSFFISAALFTAAHYLQQPFPDNAFVALFFFGLAQCWLYRKTQRIWCPMVNHALFNLTNLVLLFVVPAP